MRWHDFKDSIDVLKVLSCLSYDDFKKALNARHLDETSIDRLNDARRSNLFLFICMLDIDVQRNVFEYCNCKMMNR